jgi:nucleotide-binding universal stress UspA family protein
MKRRQEDVFEEFATELVRRRRGTAPRCSVERILVATDFSQCSLRALEYAEGLARKLGSELLLMHAEGLTLAGPGMAALMHLAAERELARTVQQLRHGHLEAQSLLRPGAPVEEIVKAAETERADLIVMGTHGRQGVARVLLGSVAEQVVRTAPCPVVTVGLRKEG